MKPELSLEEMVGQLFFIGIPGSELDPQTQRLLSIVHPGGVCLFARNIKAADQTRELLTSLRSSMRVFPFLSIDQEGGLVDRLRRVLTPMPAPAKLRSPADAADLGRIIAEALLILGFNMDFAPVVDVVTPERSTSNNGLLSRAFGFHETDVIDFSSQFIEQLVSAGCLGCIKHFPGLGASRVDSHEELPLVDIEKVELEDRDLKPYRALLHRFDSSVAVMVGHAAYPNIDLQEKDQNGRLLPSSLSFNIVSNLLRNELNFEGLVITDDLEMGAILNNYGISDACLRGIDAGADMLAICADPDRIEEGYNAVLAAARNGDLTEARLDESLSRIRIAKEKVKDPLPFNIDRLNALTQDIADLGARLN